MVVKDVQFQSNRIPLPCDYEQETSPIALTEEYLVSDGFAQT